MDLRGEMEGGDCNDSQIAGLGDWGGWWSHYLGGERQEGKHFEGEEHHQ